MQGETAITAAVFAQRDGAAAQETDVWRVLAQADQLEAFAQAWMALTAQSAGNVRRAVLLLGPPEHGPFAPVAFFPDVAARDALPGEAGSVFRAALEKRRPAVEGGADAFTRIGYPLAFAGLLHGVVLAEARPLDASATRRLIRHLQWSAAGIEAFLARDSHRQGIVAVDKAQFLIGALDAMAAEERGDDCARVFADLLARRFDCDGVAVGRWRKQSVRLVAASQSAAVDRRNAQARDVEAAMNEAVDLDSALIAPREKFMAASAHDLLARQFPDAQLLTLPLFLHDDPVAVAQLRRTKKFEQAEVDLVDAVGAAAAPLLREKWALDRSVAELAYDRAEKFGENLLGPRHFGLKVATVAGLVAALVLTFATDTYRARARAQIQGETRRLLAAPFEGFIRAQFARAGDVVPAGFVLAQLQENDLELERLRQVAKKRQYQLELDKALAKRDLAEINIARAQIAQTEAEIELSDQMIARAKISAPFEAVVVNGDLSQSIGKPVSRGDVLFELAPLDRYRVTAVVTEADVGLAKAGQKGELLLSALPDQTYPMIVDSIATVAHAADGVNGFEVIGTVEAKDGRLRPGMEGVAKIEIGRRPIVWIWTHSLFDWLRIKMWSLLP